MESPRAPTDDGDAPPTDWLGELPPELHLRILEGVEDFSDCAAFSLASPRLGLLALRSGLARFKEPLFAVAMRLLLIERLHAGSFVGAPIMDTLNEATVRAYAADRRATADHFPWLARVSPALCLSSEVTGAGASHDEYWRLRRGEENGANLRRRLLQSGTVHFYEGERGVERLVREEFADGEVQHYEGEKGAERKVRMELAGNVQYYEGERGAERCVRMELANGIVQYYEGEKGAERKVRTESPDGTVRYYAGEKGAERCVRRRRR